MPTFDMRESGIAYPEGPAFSADLFDGLDGDQYLAPPSLDRIVKSMEPGSFLYDSHFVPGISSMIETSQFIEVPDHGLTREESARAVSFGQLLLNSTDDGAHGMYVAIKPFDFPEEATHEFAVASYFADGQVDGLDTFTPLGFHRLSDTGQWSLVTHYNHSVFSLDTVFWNPNIVDNLDRPGNVQIVAKALGRGAMTAVDLHDNEWAHLDFQAKNSAWNVLSGKTFVIDLETAAPFPKVGEQIDQDAAKDMVKRDVATFAGSVFRLSDSDELKNMAMEQLPIVYSGSRRPDSVAKLSYDEVREIVETESTQTNS